MKPRQSFLVVLALFVLFASIECRNIQRLDDRTMNGENSIGKVIDVDDVDIFSQGYFEGDILDESKFHSKSAVLKGKTWPGATIPYVISTEYHKRQTIMILDAMQSIEDKTCLRFIPRTTERDYINIYKADRGCSSSVGKKGGEQRLSLMDGCFIPKKVKHELMHAMGFHHEQSRTDRDEYVTIHFDNINSGPRQHEKNFQIYDQVQLKLRTPYDIKSIMHYSWNAFALDTSKPTITAKNGAKIKPSDDFTETDILDMNRLYNCPTVEPFVDEC